jgi:hypothetical protein
VLSKGSRNSRMKDFHDLLLLFRDKSLQSSKTLHENVTKTFENRGTALRPIQFDESGHVALQRLWTAHLQGLGDVSKELDLPENIEMVIEKINSFFVINNL